MRTGVAKGAHRLTNRHRSPPTPYLASAGGAAIVARLSRDHHPTIAQDPRQAGKNCSADILGTMNQARP